MQNLMVTLSAVVLTGLLGAAPAFADAESEYRLALRSIQSNGGGGNDAQAFAHLRSAGEQGLVEAQLKLGELYLLGRGTARNYQKAFAWWQRAAAGGNPTAQYRVGLFYDTGYKGVVKRDPAKAREWYARAAALGYAVAVTRLHNVGGPGAVALTGEN